MNLTPNAATNGQTAGALAVAGSSCEGDAALDLKAIAAPARGHAKKIGTDLGQASGGARDWKGARRGAMKTAVTPSKCSIGCETNGSGRNCGASGTDEEFNKYIVAQIAQ